jgi:hypothetical protein
MRTSFLLFVAVVVMNGTIYGQISPGELARAHAKWDGVEHCTSCHPLGKSLSNANCLSCHAEIAVRMKAGTGYHAATKDAPCQKCHSEHHGSEFQITRFDTSAFDHASVGFRLEGTHAKVGCRGCHEEKYVTADDVKKLEPAQRTHTYLGLGTACISCHVDEHKGQLAKDCAQCHTTEHWKPAPKFLHDRSKYPLTGKHERVLCAKCHKPMLEDDHTIRYIRLPFVRCESCHEDIHKGKFADRACAACHTTEDFHKVGTAKFDHAATRFPLRGAHGPLKCITCHQDDPRAVNASGEHGYHITRFDQCVSCHADAHAQQFVRRKDGGRCEACHNEDSFARSTYRAADHDSSRYPLRDGHLAVSCVDCHHDKRVDAKSTRQYRWSGAIRCVTCHEDIHRGQFDRRVPNNCESCHTVKTWQTLTFSHDATTFKLRGKHAVTPCVKCHIQPERPNTPIVYAISMTCMSCHTDEHAGQFAVRGSTDCGNCHTDVSWKALSFNHTTQSQFALTGAHDRVPCAKCHPRIPAEGRSITKYKSIGTKCIDCHAPIR